MSPDCASSRVLQKEMDPNNAIKKKFYRNSNKPLGNDSKQNDLFSKRDVSTIKEFNSSIKKGISRIAKNGDSLIEEEDEGSYDNSMLRSDIEESNDFKVEDASNPPIFDTQKEIPSKKIPGINRPFSAIHIPNKNLDVPEAILLETQDCKNS